MGCNCTNNTGHDHSHTSCDNNGCGQDSYAHQVVETYADVADFHNAFVTVRDENAVYHVDEVGNPVSVSRSPVFIDNYVPEVGEWKHNSVFDFATNKQYVFNPAGEYKVVTLS